MNIKRIKIAIVVTTFVCVVFGCKQKNIDSELNYLSFKVSKDEMIDSLKVATQLLDKMDYGNGASCFWSDGKFHFIKKEGGFNVVDIPKEKFETVPHVGALNIEYSTRLFNLIHFLEKNDISGMVKRYDGIYWFGYKQTKLNPNNNFNDSRYVIFNRHPNDTNSTFINNKSILDEYDKMVLLAPKTYNEPKLPMDKESIMKRTDELMKKRKTEE